MACTDDAFAFLNPWFASLHDRVSVHETDRPDTALALSFGRDPETDWWLRIDWWKNGGSRSSVQRRQWREALLLAGALATVDPDAWVDKLCRMSGLVVPSFMDLWTHTLRAQFQLTFSEFALHDDDEITSWLATDYSDDFRRDYERLMLYVDRHVSEEGSVDRRPRLRLRLGIADGKFLPVIETMLQTYLHNTNAQEPEPLPPLLPRPRFVIDSLELVAARMRTAATVLDALRRVLELGLPINHVYLPLSDGGGDRLSPQWREAYIRFVRSLCGHGDAPSGGVHKITIPCREVAHPDFELLCSGLLHARSIRHVVIGQQHDASHGVDTADPFPPGIWALIALALMSKDSTSSVEALSVYGVPLSERDADDVFHMGALTYPLHSYASDWVPNAPPFRRMNRVPRKVRIRAGTVISGYYGRAAEEYTIQVDAPTEAYVVSEEAGVSHVLIVGRGFCEVTSSELPSKRMKALRRRQAAENNSSSLLQSLELSTYAGDTTTQQHLAFFVEFMGGRTLKRLRLQVPNLDEQRVRDVLNVCPNLEYLALTDVAMASMAPFKEARASGLALRSLELARVRVPDQELVDFLDRVVRGQDDPTADPKSPLLGLRLGSVSDVVLEGIEAILDESTIRYLDYTVASPVQSRFARFAQRFHLRPSGEVRKPLAATSTMAFLGSLCHPTQTNAASRLTDEMKALIVTFASTPYVRTVICRHHEPATEEER